MADPARSIAMSLLATALVSVSVNALFLQRIKHPAPMLDSAEIAPAPSPKPMPDHVPVPVLRSAAFSSALSQLDVSTFSVGAPAEVAHPAKTDTIGELITGTSPKAVLQAAAGKTIMAAQRALNKLGYNVRVDGVNGGTTRQAVERFERDNRLPVKGDLTPKLLRELSIAAAMPVE